MRSFLRTCILPITVAIALVCVPAQSARAEAKAQATNSTIPIEPELEKLAGDAAHDAIAKFPKDMIQERDLAVTIIDLHDPDHPRQGNFRGDEGFYPASVVKLFYLAATQRWLADGKLADTPELRRTMHDMIVDSSNDATGAIVDAVTDAPNGAVLPDAQMKQWAYKRNAMNRYFESLGYPVGAEHGINVCQHTYCDGPYGRERIFLGPHYENRNQLTTNATARLLSEIVRGKAVSAQRSKEMMELLHRDIAGKSAGPDDQAHDFTARALEPGSGLWSKAGWTNTARHDAAYVETPDHAVKVVIVTFTVHHSNQKEIIPTIAKHVIEALRKSEEQ
jgi:beta-lactamase class A